MKLDINEVYHNYITKIVIFALFTYKRQIRQPNVFKMSVISFVTKRVAWKINLVVETEQRLDKEEEREVFLNEILDGIESDYLSKVTVSFRTPLKQLVMEIDLKDEKKYQEFLYQ